MRACSRVTVTPFEPDASASASAACSAASSSRASPPSLSSGSGSGGSDGWRSPRLRSRECTVRTIPSSF